ncbi:VOC family protein [Kaistia dalseonensis]|nr:VOC family protein [Kaistia dalseonensis]MCX5493180.1 VOC family protein [Kaistia dalseonensis]
MRRPSLQQTARHLGYVTLVVDDYDRAIAYFTGVLDFDLVEDTPLGPDKRWVLVAPAGSDGARLLLAKAANEAQAGRIGDQTGGRVAFFLHTTDFERDFALFTARGVCFLEAPRQESYGTVAVFEDIFGNRWDLLELKR